MFVATTLEGDATALRLADLPDTRFSSEAALWESSGFSPGSGTVLVRLDGEAPVEVLVPPLCSAPSSDGACAASAVGLGVLSSPPDPAHPGDVPFVDAFPSCAAHLVAESSDPDLVVSTLTLSGLSRMLGLPVRWADEVGHAAQRAGLVAAQVTNRAMLEFCAQEPLLVLSTPSLRAGLSTDTAALLGLVKGLSRLDDPSWLLAEAALVSLWEELGEARGVVVALSGMGAFPVGRAASRWAALSGLPGNG